MFIRETVEEFKTFLKLESEGPRAAIVQSMIFLLDRLHGL